MNISKRKQGILAIICTIAMIVTSITVYNPREVKADPSATVDGKQYSATVKDSGEWTGFACQGIYDSARIHFAWGIDVDSNTITASIGETNLTVNGKSAKEMNIPLSEVTSLGVGSYDIVINATTVASESAEAKEISATVTLKIEKVEGTTELQKPSAPEGLVANINDLKTNYTIAFIPVTGATSYNFYLDGTYKKDITNGGIVTIKELGLEAGKTYKFGVSAVNAAGESDITTIDVTVPGQEEEYKDGEVLVNESNQTKEVPAYKDGDYWQKEYNNAPVKYVKGKKYVAEVVVSSTAAKRIKMVFQRVNNWDFVDANQGYEASIAAGNKVKITYVFEATQSTNNGNFDIYLGSAADATTMVFESKKLTTYNEVPAGVQTGVEVLEAPGTTKYTVSIDGTEEQYEEGATITVPAEGQGYYDVTKKVAYAPGTKLTVNENMTLKSIKLSVTMTKGASIRLAAPTGLRFQTTVTSVNGIAADDILDLKTGTVTTGTLITTLDLYKANGNTLTMNSKYTFLNIANDGWFNDGTKTETGKFCGSIIKIQSKNYGRKFIAVGYATIKYSDGTSKTVYAEVTVNNAKSIQYVANKVKASEKFSGYTAEQKAIINKYIDGEEISK